MTPSKRCLRKIKKEGKYNLLVLEICLVKNNQIAWTLDSKATSYVCSSLQETSFFKQLEEGEMTLKVGMEMSFQLVQWEMLSCL